MDMNNGLDVTGHRFSNLQYSIMCEEEIRSKRAARDGPKYYLWLSTQMTAGHHNHNHFHMFLGFYRTGRRPEAPTHLLAPTTNHFPATRFA